MSHITRRQVIETTIEDDVSPMSAIREGVEQLLDWAVLWDVKPTQFLIQADDEARPYTRNERHRVVSVAIVGVGPHPDEVEWQTEAVYAES